MTGKINKIAVVGAGTMGHQIALSAALAGFTVKCTDTYPAALEKAAQFVDGYLPERVAKGKLAPQVADAARAALSFTPDLSEAAGDADLVIEAVLEKLELKKEVFSRLDRICPPHAILATNSSYIVSSQIAGATGRPGQVCNMHFFNPVLVMKLVEVVKGPHVTAETADAVMEVARRMGKKAVLVQKEIYGFIVNRFVSAIVNEALYLHDMGVASFEDIDTAVENGLGHPMGPFKLMDLAGIDLTYQIAMERFQSTGDQADRPSPAIVAKWAHKEWGRKSGKGFYDYRK